MMRFCWLDRNRAFRSVWLLLLVAFLSLTPETMVVPVQVLREGDAYLAKKEYGRAQGRYESLAALLPGYALPHLRLAQVHLARAQYDRAGDEYKEGLGRDGTSVQAMVGLGVSSVEMGDLEEGARWLRQALGRKPNASQARYYLGLAYMRAGDVARAGDEFEELFTMAQSGPRDEPWRQKAHYRLGQLLIDRHPDIAIPHLAEASLAEDDRETTERAGILLQTAQAIRQYGDRPAYAAAIIGHGFLKVGETALARRQFEQAVSLKQDYVDAVAYLGYVYLLEGRPDKAQETLTRAVALEPEGPLGHFFLGMALARLKRLDGAVAELERAARLDPDNGSFLIELANALASNGDYARAERLFERAGELQPEGAETQVLLARFYLDRGYKVERGLAVAADAAARWPERGDAVGSLGWALHLNRRSEEARGELLRAVDLNPDSPEPRYRLAVVLESLGYTVAAAEQYRRAIDLDRGTDYATRAMKALEALGVRYE